ncbi:MAG TPA: SGNH/GDSL hydrolase family protein [Humisphaera sp.]
MLAKLFATVLALVGPAPKDAPADLQLKPGDQIVAMGDSITQGGGGATGYLTLIDLVLAKQYPDLKLPKTINAGISGQKAEDMVKRFEKDVVARKPAVVTISVGINDVWHRLKNPHDEQVLATYKANLTKMVDMAQAAGAKVIILSPTIIQEDPEHEGNKRLPMYVAAGREIAAEKKCAFVDLHGMFLTALKQKPAEMGKKNWITGDGVHMNAQGNAMMAIGALRAMGVPDEKIAATEVPTPATKPAKK